MLSVLLNIRGSLQMSDTNDKKLKNKQYKIYKLSTFDFFTEEENEKYNEIKKCKCKMTEMVPVFEKFSRQRELNSDALSRDNEIALFDNDILRLVRDNDSTDKLIKEIVFIKIYHNVIMKQILESGFKCGQDEFEFFTASAGQIRNKTITLHSRDNYNENRLQTAQNLHYLLIFT